MAVHGTDSAVAWKIADTGYATLSTLDSGFYGSGMYFTTSASYALPYFGNQSHPALMICLVVPGNPFPVIERATDKDSLLGQPRRSGYQSNYVLTKLNGEPIDEMESIPTAGVFDELVLGQESQALPCFIIEFDPLKLEKISRRFERTVVEPGAVGGKRSPLASVRGRPVETNPEMKRSPVSSNRAHHSEREVEGNRSPNSSGRSHPTLANESDTRPIDLESVEEV